MRSARVGVASERRRGQLEHVVARAVGHERCDILGAERRTRHQQRDALDFLLRGEQVAFDAVGEQLRGAAASIVTPVLGRAARGSSPAGARARPAA